MTYEEAIEGLNYLISDDCTDTQHDYIEEIELAIKALEKQIPKKPNIELRGTTGWNTTIHCPTCKSLMPSIRKYCGECGQRLE